MIQAIASLLERLIKQSEVNDHATFRVGATANDHFSAVRMAMDPATRLGIHSPLKRVGGVESELLTDFIHQRMPMNLCVCRDRRQRGCCKQ